MSKGRLVDVAPFRERFLELRERGEVDAAEVAKRLGWRHGNGRWRSWDGRRLERTLGLKPSHGGRATQQSVEYETAVVLCKALEIEFVDAGV